MICSLWIGDVRIGPAGRARQRLVLRNGARRSQKVVDALHVLFSTGFADSLVGAFDLPGPAELRGLAQRVLDDPAHCTRGRLSVAAGGASKY